ncbi:hypothetical protein BKA66DRAFT_113990 [Pyrenochaeta sp. MPI-SDFR-AT-0127]|nr:hypothetical protein BKA66DRAFT_113990 [Pyrenochaeta sp. MPI-SDFR-AT-0127]
MHICLFILLGMHYGAQMLSSQTGEKLKRVGGFMYDLIRTWHRMVWSGRADGERVRLIYKANLHFTYQHDAIP